VETPTARLKLTDLHGAVGEVILLAVELPTREPPSEERAAKVMHSIFGQSLALEEDVSLHVDYQQPEQYAFYSESPPP